MSTHLPVSILSNPLNQFDEIAAQGVQEVGTRLILQSHMKINSYSEDLLCHKDYGHPSIVFASYDIFCVEHKLWKEFIAYNSTSMGKDFINAEDTAIAFLATLPQEDIDELIESLSE